MPATYEPIATTTLGSAASSITFSSIPSTYTDLRLVLVAKVTINDYPYIQFNSDNGTNYSYTYLQGNGTAASSGKGTTTNQLFLDSSTNWSTAVPQLAQIDIFSYAGSTYKTLLINCSKDESTYPNVNSEVGLWRSTSAINRIDLFARGAGNNFASNTTATLYGILKA